MGTPSTEEVWRRRKSFRLHDTAPQVSAFTVDNRGQIASTFIGEHTCKCGYNVCSGTGPCAQVVGCVLNCSTVEITFDAVYRALLNVDLGPNIVGKQATSVPLPKVAQREMQRAEGSPRYACSGLGCTWTCHNYRSIEWTNARFEHHICAHFGGTS